MLTKIGLGTKLRLSTMFESCELRRATVNRESVDLAVTRAPLFDELDTWSAEAPDGDDDPEVGD